MIYERDLDEIAERTAAHPYGETGGDLFGFFTHGGNPAVQLTLGPGPRARHEEAAFFQDVDHLRTRGAMLQAAYGLQHIGDWHSHHRFALDGPSEGDVATVHRTLERNGLDRFVVCIANLRTGPERAGDPSRRAHGGAPRAQPASTAQPARTAQPAGTGRSNPVLVTINAYLFRAGEPRAERGRFVVLPGESPIAAAARHDGVLGPPARRGTPWYVQEVGRGQVLTIAAGWHSGEWGTAYLRELDALLRRSYEDCRLLMVRGTDLTYEFTAGRRRCRIVFPPAFPSARAELTVGDVTRHMPGGSDTPRDFHAAVAEMLAREEDGDGVVDGAGLAP